MSKFKALMGQDIPIEEQKEKQANDVGNKCSRCEKKPSNGMHTCPFSEEINDDHETLCDCCDDCEYECAMDI